MRIIFFLLLAVSAQAQTQLYGTTIINATSGLQLPVGNNAQRVNAFGMIRANTESGGIEVYDGSWQKATYFTGGLDKNVSIVYDGSGWVTELPVHGEIYNTNVGSVTINAAYDTLVNLSTTGEVSNFEHVGRALKYTGTYAIRVLVNYNLSVEGTGSTILFTRVRHNTTSVDKSTSTATTEDANDVYSVTNSCILSLQPDDLVWIEVAADANSTPFTIYNANLIITKL